MIASKLLSSTSKPSSITRSRLLFQTLLRQTSCSTNITTNPPPPSQRQFATAAAAASKTAGDTLTEVRKLNPHKEILRYEHKNVKWTMKHVDDFSEMLAIGFLETGLTKGDAVLSWLPDHWSEQHILQFACSKAGLILHTLSPAHTSPTILSRALTSTSATVLVTPEHHDDVNYVDIVKDVMPEILIFDFARGAPFLSPRFPHMRFPIHTGFDHEDKSGLLPLKHFLVPSENLEEFTGAFGAMDGSTELFCEVEVTGDDNVSLGKVMTNDEVVKSGVWPVFNSILKREYSEIEGVGVIF
jgi:hypothetical protein